MQMQIKVYAKWLLISSLIGLSGCAGVALRHDYSDYSRVYADSINKQLLLNLARLSHDEPAYFIQLGSISSQYQFSTSAGFTPSHSSVAHPNGLAASAVQDTLTLGGNLNAGATETPIFQFFPLNGTNFAEAIATPISDRVFFTFYDQGFHADLLARTTVAAIQIEMANSNRTNYVLYINNPYDPTYPQFLEYCDGLRKAQLYHTLIFITAKHTDTVYKEQKANLSEVVNANAAGLNVEFNTNSNYYTVTKSQQDSAFITNSAAFDNNEFRNLYQFNSQYQVKAQKDLNEALAVTKAYKEGHVKFKMRTFEAVMYSVAKEDTYFQELEDTNNLHYTNIAFTNDPYGTIAYVTRTNNTRLAFRPIIKINYGYEEHLNLSRLPDVTYEGDIYTVGDLEGKALEKDPMYQVYHNMQTNIDFPEGFPKTYNRTVFTMITYLFSQIAIDTTKLPAQQLIQVQ